VWQRPRTEIELDKRLKIEKSSKKSAGSLSHPGCTPSLRITVNALHSTQQIEDFVSAVKTASEKVLLGGQCAR
jgi:7-keto-8-aminopelargonate synthetase-like enzyme